MVERTAGNEPTTYNLLFVCTGNTCRSPMAAAIARKEAKRRGWTHVAVRSAGTGAMDGGRASPETLAVLKEQGIEDPNHFSQQLTPELVQWADLILAMSLSHMYVIQDFGGGEKSTLITDFLEDEEIANGVEDPYGQGIEVYQRTFTQLERAIMSMMSRLEPILSP